MSTANNSQLSTLNYQLPTGYKQTEVGVIPEDWDATKLGDALFARPNSEILTHG